MTRIVAVCLVAALAGQARDPGCGAGSREDSTMIGAPCTRPKDCAPGSTCSAGVCISLDAGQTDSGDGGDGGD